MTYGFIPHSAVRALVTTFFPMPMSGGGQVTTLDWPTTSSPFFATTDVGGGYIWNTGKSRWDQLITTIRMPAAFVGLNGSNAFNKLNGLYAVASAPNTPARVYLFYGAATGGDAVHAAFVSNDGGATFTQLTNWPAGMQADPNAAYKFRGPKLAVDPNNKDVLYIATPYNGIKFSNDGGVTWSVPSGITVSGSLPGCISFGPAANTTTVSSQTRTATVWANSPGNGVYKSTNGGVSFTLIASSVTNVGCFHASSVTGSDVCFCGTDQGDGWTHLYRIKGTTWENITNGPLVGGASCFDPIPSPFNVDILYLVNQGGSIYWSSNATSAAAASVAYTGQQSVNSNITATDVPWLAMGGTINYLSAGRGVFDPGSAATPKLYVPGGTGIWSTITGPGANITPAYVSQTVGIEELVSTCIAKPPGGVPVSTHWDRPVVYHSNIDAAPSSYEPNYPNLSVTAGWAVDWASSTPTFMVALVIGSGTEPNESTCYSSSGGAAGTWSRYFTTAGKHIPNLATAGGCIAASTPNNIVLAYSNQNDVYYTLDNGATNWNKVAAATFGHGVRNSGNIVITVTAATTSGGTVTCTCASTAAICNGYDQISGGATNTLPGITGSFAGNPAITVIDATHFSLAGSFTGTLTSNGTLTYFPSTGWGEIYYSQRHGVCADRDTAVNPNTFYIYNSMPTAFGGGIYKSADGGVTWTQQISAHWADTGQEKLRSVPKLAGCVSPAGHLFFASAYAAGAGGSLRYSRNGGTSWVTVLGVSEPYAVGFGAPLVGNNYPTVFLMGFVNSVFGLWRCTATDTQWLNSGVTPVLWLLLSEVAGTQPSGTTDRISYVEGDPDVYGRVYLGNGNSVFYGALT